jgi:4-hydroxybenzoate polyprenyltransferase
MNRYLSLIKFSHTIFAMPFALLGFFLALLEDSVSFSWQTLFLVVLCMVFARSAAMAFNRFLDRDIDRRNPRTQSREIPSGVVTPRQALLFTLANAALFILCTWFLNPLCFYLSPVALLVVLGYSYTKRFTSLCHLVLGLGLSLAPVGAYLAAAGHFAFLPILLGLAVLCWVAGFDIIYALQDDSFDREHRLYSIPSQLGREQALRLSELLHLACAGILIWAGFLLSNTSASFQWLHWVAIASFILLLIYQHRLVKPGDLSKVDLAFFTTNGVASLIFATLIVLDMYL